MPPKGPEYQLQVQIAELATILGWEHVAFRPLKTKYGVRTPGSGTMAKGWPDLTLVRARDRRLIFAELKGTKYAKPSDDQTRVLDVLRALEGEHVYIEDTSPEQPETSYVAIEVHVWRPDDWDSIERILR